MYYTIRNNQLIEWSDVKEHLEFKDEAKELLGVDEITFNSSKYGVADGILTDISDTPAYKNSELTAAKKLKMAENEKKRNVEYIETSLGRLKTDTPLGDLKVAIPLFEKLALSLNGLPEGAVRLYNEDGEVILSPSISATEFEIVVMEIATEYMEIDSKSTSYSKRIQQAQTIEELNAIVIEY